MAVEIIFTAAGVFSGPGFFGRIGDAMGEVGEVLSESTALLRKRRKPAPAAQP